MNILSTAPAFFHNLAFSLQPKFFAILSSIPLATKVYEFAKQHFKLLQYVCVFAFGTKELTYDRVCALEARRPSKIDGDAPHEFYTAHGILFTASGVAGIAAAVGTSLLLQHIALGFFNCGNIVALLYYGEVLHHSSDPVERKSAAFGLLSNLGYILSTASFILALPEIIALLLGFLALTCGGIKIIYDAYHLVFGS